MKTDPEIDDDGGQLVTTSDDKSKVSSAPEPGMAKGSGNAGAPAAESKADPKANPKAGSNADPKAGVNADSRAESKVESKPDSSPEPKDASNASSTVPASSSESKVESKPVSNPEPKVESKPVSNPESKVESKPVSNAESKPDPESKVESKPVSNAESKPDPEPEVESKPVSSPATAATPDPNGGGFSQRSRASTLVMPMTALVGAPPDVPTATAPALQPTIGAVEDPTHMPAPRQIPGGEPNDPAAPPGRVPRGDSRSLRRGDEFALVYRVGTFVISRFGTVGTRGQWRVVEYPTSSSASHAYAKECSRFVTEGFSDYRD